MPAQSFYILCPLRDTDADSLQGFPQYTSLHHPLANVSKSRGKIRDSEGAFFGCTCFSKGGCFPLKSTRGASEGGMSVFQHCDSHQPARRPDRGRAADSSAIHAPARTAAARAGEESHQGSAGSRYRCTGRAVGEKPIVTHSIKALRRMFQEGNPSLNGNVPVLVWLLTTYQ